MNRIINVKIRYFKQNWTDTPMKFDNNSSKFLQGFHRFVGRVGVNF